MMIPHPTYSLGVVPADYLSFPNWYIDMHVCPIKVKIAVYAAPELFNFGMMTPGTPLCQMYHARRYLVHEILEADKMALYFTRDPAKWCYGNSVYSELFLIIRVLNIEHIFLLPLICHLRKPRVLIPLRPLRVRKERSGLSNLGLRSC